MRPSGHVLMLAAAMLMFAAALVVVAARGSVVEVSGPRAFARLDLLCAGISRHGGRATSIPPRADAVLADVVDAQAMVFDRASIDAASVTCGAAVTVVRLVLLPAAPLGVAIARYGAAAGAAIVRPVAPRGGR